MTFATPRFALIVSLGAGVVAAVASANPSIQPPPVLIDGTVLSIDGAVPMTGPDYVLIPFQVPAGTVEVEVKHENLNSANILDWGLMDPSGYRGWGGGNVESAIVGLLAASRSYLPGAMPAGTWNIVLGKASIMSQPANYHIEIDLRTVATLAPQTQRRPYTPVAALRTGPDWYAGDLHAHSVQSGDAYPSIDTMATFALGIGLDFLEISDHNTVAQLDFLDVEQKTYPTLLFMPGVEFTTYNGHANGIGATAYVPHEIGLNGNTIEAAAQAFQQQGAVFSVNHPALNLSICLGCQWNYTLDPSLIDSVEIATGAWNQAGQFFDNQALAFWDTVLDTGRHVPGVGGSDDHRGGVDVGMFHSDIGSPTTMVYATELSASAIVAGIRAGRTVVKLQGPTDPMVTMTADDGSMIGDTVHGSTHLHITVTGGMGGQVQMVQNGNLVDPVDVTSDPFEWTVWAPAPATGEDRWRAMASVDQHPITVTSHIWVTQALPKSHSSGCGVVQPSFLLVLAAALLMGLRMRRQR